MSTFKFHFFLLVYVLFQIYLTEVEGANKKVVCYFTNWAQYREGEGKFLPGNIPPKLCTHIIFAFGKFDASNHEILPYDPKDPEFYTEIQHLKKCNPDLKVLLAIGGATFGTAPFVSMSSTEEGRKSFAKQAASYLKANHFDGLDMDWEFPTSAEKDQFTQLMQELRNTFNVVDKNLLLTAAVPINGETVRNGFDVPAIAKELDFINVMAYDMHGPWDNNLGHNAPLHPTPDNPSLNVEFSANLWAKMGVPKEKLIIGVPSYGRSLVMQSPNGNKPNDPLSKEEGYAGRFTKTAGNLAYYEVCELLKKGNKNIFDEKAGVPYAIVDKKHWVSYENDKSATLKAEFVNKNGYGGAMVWDLDHDDFTGHFCGKGKFPIINSLNKVLRGGNAQEYVADQGCTGKPSTPDEKPSIPVEIDNNYLGNVQDQKDIDIPSIANRWGAQPEIPSETGEVVCNAGPGKSSYHKDPANCKMYYVCEGTRKHHMPCPAGLGFNWKVNVCDWAFNIPGCQ